MHILSLYSHLGVKTGQHQQTFVYFSITVATTPIFDYLLEFQVDFKEHLVALVNDFHLLFII